MAELARAQAAGLDDARCRARRTGCRWSATTRRGSSLRSSASVRTAGSWCRSTSGSAPRRSSYIVEHSGASVLLVDPELDEHLADVTAAHRFVIGTESDEALYRLRCGAETVGRSRRRRHRVDQLHQRHHRAPEGRPDSRIATCGSTPRRSVGSSASMIATCTCTRCRCSTATAGAARTWSPGWAAATSCCARSTARRSCAASTSTA